MSLKELMEKAEQLQGNHDADFVLVDNKLRRPIKFEREPRAQILQLAKEKGLITCEHYRDDQSQCSIGCKIEAAKNLLIVKTKAIID